MLNRTLCVAGAIATLSVAVAPAYAGRVLRVSAEAALDGSVPLVVHSEGGGIILDFSPTGETIQKISLDDQSKIVYDHCLLTKSCGNHPNPTVRLFRSKGIAFADLPSVKATLLTVETLDSSNEWHSYIFPITTSNAPATYNKVLIGESPSLNRSRYGGSLVQRTESGGRSEASYALTALGVRQAEQKHLLVDPQLKGRVQNYLQLTQSGMSDKLASRRAGISLALVQHLQELGQQRVDEITAQQKAAQLAAQQQTTASGQVAEATQGPEPKHKYKARHTEDQTQLAPAATVTPIGRPDNSQTVALNTGGAAQPAQSAVQTPITKPVQKVTPVQRTTPVQSPAPVQRVTPVSTPQPKVVSHQAYANALLRGLNKARLDGKIRYGSDRWYSVNGAIRLLRRGFSLDKAIAVSGLQKDKFMKLLSDGGIES